MAYEFFNNDAIFRGNVTIDKDLTLKGTFGITTLSATSAVIVDVETSTPAVRITQRGTGDALVVEDSTNPDSTPLVVNQYGQIISGTLSAWNSIAGLQLNSDSASVPNANIALRRNCNDSTVSSYLSHKARGTTNAPLDVLPDDFLGNFASHGYLAGDFRNAGAVRCAVDGVPVPALSSVPGRLTFSTVTSGNNANSEKMRITHDGKVGIGTTTPNELLTVAGSISATGNIVVDTETSTPAVRITQRGTGDALVVEDSTNPDSTRFVINQNGQIISGTLSAWHIGAGLQLNSDTGGSIHNANIALRRNNNSTSANSLTFYKARGTFEIPLLVNKDDTIGQLVFEGHIGNNITFVNSNTDSGFRVGAVIRASVDDTPSQSLSSIPGRLTFLTTLSGNRSETERMRITHDGKVGIGTTSPNELLTVAGNISASGNIYGNINAGDLPLRALSGNWQSTYTTVSSNSAKWDESYNNTVYVNVSSTSSSFIADPIHSGFIIHVNTNSGPLTAYFDNPLPSGFNLGIVNKGSNSLFIKSTNALVDSLGSELIFRLDKAFVYRQEDGDFVALGDLV